jgi:hypothetical protein
MFLEQSKLYLQSNLNYSLEQRSHQKKILELLRINLPKFAKEFMNADSCALAKNIDIDIDDENYISGQLSTFLNNNVNDIGYIFSFRAVGPDILVHQFPHLVHKPELFVAEAKRLPPTKKQDYVLTGIRRFKMEEHGMPHDIAAMLGYVQDKNFNHWYDEINLWIEDLIADTAQKPRWEQQDKLNKVGVASYGEYTSTHSRVKMGPITLHHFWLDFCNN